MNGQEGFLEFGMLREDCYYDVDGRLDDDLTHMYGVAMCDS